MSTTKTTTNRRPIDPRTGLEYPKRIEGNDEQRARVRAWREQHLGAVGRVGFSQVLAAPCARHQAEAGAPCFRPDLVHQGVCGPRIRAVLG
ncbi:hypothetical protein ACTQ49_11725 [Luteococcus sp. Sow4_B9]|uniref:hypothetical protein n=1 Tax=Luteococcus sp. Sow4_B9 TaxID=3438792 RepID=UPI003F958B1F